MSLYCVTLCWWCVVCLGREYRGRPCAREHCATADRAMGAEHLIWADGLRGEPVYKALTHPAIQSKGKARHRFLFLLCFRLWHLCRDDNFSFSRCLASILPVSVFNHSSGARRVDYATSSAWKTQPQDGEWQKRLTSLRKISPMWHLRYNRLFIMFGAKHKRLKELLRIKVL